MPRAILALLVTAVLALTACTSSPQPQQQKPHKPAVTIEVAHEPRTLNPVAGYAPDGAAQFYDGLFEHRSDGRLEPALATELPAPDAAGTTLTVPIRQGVRFSDGSKLRPEDVAATYQAVLDPAYESPLRGRFSALRGVDVSQDGQVRFTLNRPDPAFTQLLTLGIVPAKALRPKRPAAELPISSHPVGTGPFRFAGWRRGAELSMTGRGDYWGQRVKPGKVTVRFQPDEQRRFADVRAKKADVAPVANSERGSAPDGTSPVGSRSAEYRTVTLPESNPVTADPAVRRALNLAVDRNALVRERLDGIGEPASTPLTSAEPEFQASDTVYPFDRQRAKQQLENAGWKATPEQPRAKHGTEARLRLRYPDGDPTARRLADAFAEAARAVGVFVEPAPGPAGPDEAELRTGGDPFQPGLSDATAAAQTEPGQRAVAFRARDREYFAKPDQVVLARMEHTYLVADRIRGYQAVLDPAQVSFTWGLCWNLQDWSA